jgi:hypothetical protein
MDLVTTVQDVAMKAYESILEFITSCVHAYLTGRMESPIVQCQEIQRSWEDELYRLQELRRHCQAIQRSKILLKTSNAFSVVSASSPRDSAPCNVRVIARSLNAKRSSALESPRDSAHRIVGYIMHEDEFKALESIVDEWTKSNATGIEAWALLQKNVLRSHKPSQIGCESVTGVAQETSQCGEEHPEESEKPMFVSAVVNIEAQAIFDFLEDLFVSSSTRAGATIQADIWVKSMKGLGVNVQHPSAQTVKTIFRARVVDAMTIECRSLGWISLVKACICLEVIRRTKTPEGGLPVGAAPFYPESTGTLLSASSRASSTPLLEKRSKAW